MDKKLLVTDPMAAATAVILNPALKVWQCNGLFPHALPLQELNGTLGSIRLIDQCSGSIPQLFSRQALQVESLIAVDATLLFDSNVSRYMEKYLRGTLNARLAAEIATLLTWFARNEVNVHTGFSLMETTAGRTDSVLNGTAVTRMGLLLNGIDRKAYLQTGEIKLGARGLRFLMRTYGTHDLDRASAMEFASLGRIKHSFVDVQYAALLAIALIEDSVPYRTLELRIDRFIDFLDKTLHGFLPLELVVAVLYFAGTLGKFIPLRATTAIEQRLANVRSSAWDLYLGRSAADIIALGDESKLSIPFIVTADGRLSQIMRAYRLMGVLAKADGWSQSVYEIDYDYLESVATGWTCQALMQRLRAKDSFVDRSHNVDLASIIANLEAEARERFSRAKTTK